MPGQNSNPAVSGPLGALHEHSEALAYCAMAIAMTMPVKKAQRFMFVYVWPYDEGLDG